MEWISLIYSSVLPQVIHAGTRAALAARGLLGSSQRKKKPKQRRRTPTAEAARVVQGRSIKLRGWKEYARVKGKQAQGGYMKEAQKCQLPKSNFCTLKARKAGSINRL